MTVLVTGGAGFVGSHVCKALAGRGIVPVVYDNLSHGHRWAVQWGPLEIGELADRQRLSDVMAKYRPAAVLHFASSIEAGESVRNPGAFYENNVCFTLGLLKTMRRNGIDRLVFSSSAAVYGNPHVLPMPESHPKNPVSPYGATKLMCERILSDFAVAHGLRSVSLRYFNAAGADPEGDLGEAHHPETHLIPIVLDAAAGLRPHISIFGNDYDTPDGTCVRDYVHVSDLAEAHCLALVRSEKIFAAEAFNLGTGQGYSVREVIAAARRVTAATIPTKTERRRAGDPASLVADPSAAIRVLGWSPERAELDTQIDDAWRWQRKQAGNRDALATGSMAAAAAMPR
ncbi:MAG: UDP-glucose 4-epimerase GalE [Rhodospirillaceae bacterium]